VFVDSKPTCSKTVGWLGGVNCELNAITHPSKQPKRENNMQECYMLVQAFVDLEFDHLSIFRREMCI
jgi:hypothetical protein